MLVWRDALMKCTATARNEDALNRHLLTRMRSYTYNEAFLRQVKTPTLYLWGETDPLGGVELGRSMATAQSGATFKSFSDVCHSPWLDDPDGHARLVQAFLR